LHQTWSKPTYARIPKKGEVSGFQDVLIFGNGYNPINDDHARNPNVIHQDSGALFIVDARTGELVKRIDELDDSDMKWSIPSDISVVDLDFNGAADLLLFGDLGGNI